MASKKRWVIVCTEKRGVFCGRVSGPTDGVDPVVLTDAQMAVYWSADVRGVLGLAATGPTAGCRITAPVPRMELRGVTAIMDCTPEAVQAWQGAPWVR